MLSLVGARERPRGRPWCRLVAGQRRQAGGAGGLRPGTARRRRGLSARATAAPYARDVGRTLLGGELRGDAVATVSVDAGIRLTPRTPRPRSGRPGAPRSSGRGSAPVRASCAARCPRGAGDRAGRRRRDEGRRRTSTAAGRRRTARSVAVPVRGPVDLDRPACPAVRPRLPGGLRDAARRSTRPRDGTRAACCSRAFRDGRGDRRGGRGRASRDGARSRASPNTYALRDGGRPSAARVYLYRAEGGRWVAVAADAMACPCGPTASSRWARAARALRTRIGTLARPAGGLRRRVRPRDRRTSWTWRSAGRGPPATPAPRRWTKGGSTCSWLPRQRWSAGTPRPRASFFSTRAAVVVPAEGAAATEAASPSPGPATSSAWSAGEPVPGWARADAGAGSARRLRLFHDRPRAYGLLAGHGSAAVADTEASAWAAIEHRPRSAGRRDRRHGRRRRDGRRGTPATELLAAVDERARRTAGRRHLRAACSRSTSRRDAAGARGHLSAPAERRSEWNHRPLRCAAPEVVPIVQRRSYRSASAAPEEGGAHARISSAAPRWRCSRSSRSWAPRAATTAAPPIPATVVPAPAGRRGTRSARRADMDAGDMLATICESGTLRVATDPQYPPASSLDETTGEWEGFDVDTAEELAARLGRRGRVGDAGLGRHHGRRLERPLGHQRGLHDHHARACGGPGLHRSVLLHARAARGERGQHRHHRAGGPDRQEGRRRHRDDVRVLPGGHAGDPGLSDRLPGGRGRHRHVQDRPARASTTSRWATARVCARPSRPCRSCRARSTPASRSS